MLTKDKEIEKLTKKTLSLSDSMSNHTRQLTLQSQFDMTTALRQSTKEKILLEMKSSGKLGAGVYLSLCYYPRVLKYWQEEKPAILRRLVLGKYMAS